MWVVGKRSALSAQDRQCVCAGHAHEYGTRKSLHVQAMMNLWYVMLWLCLQAECAYSAASEDGAASAAAAASAVLPSRGLLAAGAQASSR